MARKEMDEVPPFSKPTTIRAGASCADISVCDFNICGVILRMPQEKWFRPCVNFSFNVLTDRYSRWEYFLLSLYIKLAKTFQRDI